LFSPPSTVILRGETKCWVHAKDLDTTISIKLTSDSFATVRFVTTFDTIAKVYNIEVADNHNYFITEQGLLVHNHGCDTWKTLAEPIGLEKAIFKKFGEQGVEEFEKIKLRLAQGQAGGNIHDLGKGRKAVDIGHSGKGRGAGRLIFRETEDGIIDIEGFTGDHNYKKIKSK
jgi:hypothetical protein